MEGKAILTVLGVAWLASAGCCKDDVSGPIGEVKEIATPEVVLQLKYEQGALNRIYLTQFRPESARAAAAVPAPTQLCADLCHAGLGGSSCGPSCTEMVPVGLATALRSENRSSSQLASSPGSPRVAVCPTLCDYQLGAPLCNCPERQDRQDRRGRQGWPGEGEGAAVNWDAICDVFCHNDGYVLGGCPVCNKVSVPSVPSVASTLAGSRQLDTVEGWVSWCSVQCRQGHGGAACNCDRAPFQ